MITWACPTVFIPFHVIGGGIGLVHTTAGALEAFRGLTGRRCQSRLVYRVCMLFEWVQTCYSMLGWERNAWWAVKVNYFNAHYFDAWVAGLLDYWGIHYQGLTYRWSLAEGWKGWRS